MNKTLKTLMGIVTMIFGLAFTATFSLAEETAPPATTAPAEDWS